MNQATTPLFLRKGMIDSLEHDLKRDANVNITLGPVTYCMIKGDDEIRKGYETLMKMGALIGVAPDNKASEKLTSDSSYIVEFSDEHEKYREGSRKSRPVSKFYINSISINDFSLEFDELPKKKGLGL